MTARTRSTTNGQTPQQNSEETERIEETFVKQQPATPPQTGRDWQATAQQLDAEVRFWKTKYFEAVQYTQSQSQVIAALARPQMEQDARQQAELLARFAGMQQSDQH